jgi:hypothetical protein
MRLHQQSFLSRMGISGSKTRQIMDLLFENKKIQAFSITTETEDKGGIDYFISWQDKKNIPIQFKLRMDKWKDIPVLRFQPFYGSDSQQTVLGRDYKGLKKGITEWYFHSYLDENNEYTKIVATQSGKLLKIIEDAEKEWFPTEAPWDYFQQTLFEKYNKQKIFNRKLKKASNGVEAWYKKNPKEPGGKINYYVPYNYGDINIDLKINNM